MTVIKPKVIRNTLVKREIIKSNLFGDKGITGFGTPKIVQFIATNITTAFVDWAVVTDATGYDVEYSTDNGNTWIPV